MPGSILSLARFVYRATPSRRLRQFYFDSYARVVRDRRKVVDIGGSRFDLDLGESIDLRLFLGEFESDVAAVLRRETGAGMTVLDIGANVGAHTLLLASRVGPEGRVVAFEPTHYAWQKLERNLGLNSVPWVTAVNAALADEDAKAKKVDFRSSWRTDGSRRDGPGLVDFLRLDTWCRQNALTRVDLIKIDVDGNEYSALAGGLNLLERSKPVLIMEAVSPHFAAPARDPFKLLEGLGYDFYDLSTSAKLSYDQLRQRLPASDPGMTVSTNVLARARGTT